MLVSDYRHYAYFGVATQADSVAAAEAARAAYLANPNVGPANSAAQQYATTKLIEAGVLPPNTSYLQLSKINFTPDQQALLDKYWNEGKVVLKAALADGVYNSVYAAAEKKRMEDEFAAADAAYKAQLDAQRALEEAFGKSFTAIQAESAAKSAIMRIDDRSAVLRGEIVRISAALEAGQLQESVRPQLTTYQNEYTTLQQQRPSLILPYELAKAEASYASAVYQALKAGQPPPPASERLALLAAAETSAKQQVDNEAARVAVEAQEAAAKAAADAARYAAEAAKASAAREAANAEAARQAEIARQTSSAEAAAAAAAAARLATEKASTEAFYARQSAEAARMATVETSRQQAAEAAVTASPTSSVESTAAAIATAGSKFPTGLLVSAAALAFKFLKK